MGIAMYDFDTVIDRRGTYSVKYSPASHGLPEDVLPMWVADMDFAAPPCVSDALAKQAAHGVYGYSEPDDGYFDILREWYIKRFGWSTERKWVIVTPGVVNAIYAAIQALTDPGDRITIQQPVYGPFASSVRNTGRQLLVNRLVYENGGYGIDFDDFEEKIKQSKLFILCSPHNPAGRVWRQAELTQMGDICLRHGVIVISDEIHQDFVYPGNEHHVFAGPDGRFADISVICTAPSKTFNLAGMPHSNIFVSNDKMREKIENVYVRNGLGSPDVMGIIACRAAYAGGGGWLDGLVRYLEGNMACIREFLKTQLPAIGFAKPEGTYLAWFDCTRTGLSASELDDLLINKGRLWLNNGKYFGAGGEGFMRMNAACPRSVLEEGLRRLKKAFGSM